MRGVDVKYPEFTEVDADEFARYLYSSSACVYPEHLQTDADVTALREQDAYPANPAGRLRLGEAGPAREGGRAK